MVQLGDIQISKDKFKDNELVNLTNAWKAAGRPENKEPKQWKRKSGREFIETLTKKLKVPSEHLWNSVPGRYGGTFAHWQVFLAYAKYLSPEFRTIDPLPTATTPNSQVAYPDTATGSRSSCLGPAQLASCEIAGFHLLDQAADIRCYIITLAVRAE